MVNPQADMKDLEDYEDMLEYVCKKSNSVALFGIETGMQVMLRKLQLGGSRCQIIAFTKGVFSAFQTMGFVKNSPYSHMLNMK